jgi:hypothetical protein
MSAAKACVHGFSVESACTLLVVAGGVIKQLTVGTFPNIVDMSRYL